MSAAPSLDPLNSAVSPANAGATLQALVRDVSRSRLAVAACVDENFFHVEDVACRDDFSYGHWLSFILLNGTHLQLVFRAHFMSKAVTALVASSLRRPVEAVTMPMTMDFMREYCNLTAGRIKACLAESDIITGLSLPLITRGFDEVTFSDHLKETQQRDYWRIVWAGGELTCTTVMELLRTEDMPPLKWRAQELASADNAVEFL